MAKKFFYVCAGVLMLALAYHFGATSATAQLTSNDIAGVAADGYGLVTVVTVSGEVYRGAASVPYFHAGNLFTGGATATQQETWGAVKQRYR